MSTVKLVVTNLHLADSASAPGRGGYMVVTAFWPELENTIGEM